MAFVRDTTNVVVGGGTGTGAIGTGSGATVNDSSSKVSNTVNFLQNPSLAGAAALYGQSIYPFRNELDQFASYAPIFTLGCLTNIELNFPLTYRTLGPAVKIIRSGGAGGPTIPSLFDLDGKREFFIEDVKVKNVIAPNPNSRHTNVTNINFKVIEPYSMGQLFHNLRTASLVTGHKNYVDAPFLLSVAFIGYDDDGNVKSPFFSQRHFPIQIVQIEMEVSESGAVYNVQAVPYSEKATTNRVARIRTDVTIKGNTVHEVLQTGGESLTTIMNRTADEQESALQVSQQDKYVIYFPNRTVTGALGTLSSVGATISNGLGSVPGSVQSILESIVGKEAANSNPAGALGRAFEDQAVLTTGSFMGDQIRTRATVDINEIGRSTILRPGSLDSAENVVFQLPSFVVSPTNPQVIVRGKMQYNVRANTFTFASGSSIMDIIEEMLIISEYGREFAAARPSSSGRVPWFRIETQTFNVGGLLGGLVKGVSPKVFVYRVVPYQVDTSTIAGPGGGGIVSKVVKQLFAAKAYNYIYTGVNKDIIDFDLNFNLTFFSGVQAARSQRQLASVLGGGIFMGAGDRQSVGTTQFNNAGIAAANGQTQIQDDAANSTADAGAQGGGVSDDNETSIARTFNDYVINTGDDMIVVDLKIHGDPYYICDVSLGNFVGLPSVPFLPVTIDGALNPIDGEVHIILNFRTPIDYDDEDGFVKYPLGGFLPIAMFSGLYQVLTVESDFSDGKFVQTLKLVRKKNQDLTIESIASSVLSFIKGGVGVISKGINGISNVGRPTVDQEGGF